jgi:hypothetical protein
MIDYNHQQPSFVPLLLGAPLIMSPEMEMDGSSDHEAESAPPSPTKKSAPVRRLPKIPFNSVEFPGHISENPSSLDKALESLGSQPALDACFNRSTRMLELRYDTQDFWSHPIIGESVPVQRLVLKVTRRRRKLKVPGEQSNNTQNDVATRVDLPVQESSQATTAVSNASVGGVFKAEVIGVVKSTVRFRGECTRQTFRKRLDANIWPTAMADYRYTPDITARIPRLIEALKSADRRLAGMRTVQVKLMSLAPTALSLMEFDFQDSEMPRIVPNKATPLDPSLTTGGANEKTDEPNSGAHAPASDNAIEFKSTMPTIPPPMFSRQVAPHSFL